MYSKQISESKHLTFKMRFTDGCVLNNSKKTFLYYSVRFGLRATLLIIGGLQLNNVVLSVLLRKPLTKTDVNTRSTVMENEQSTPSANSDNDLQYAHRHIKQGIPNELTVVHTTNNDKNSVIDKHINGRHFNKGYTSTSVGKEKLENINNTVCDSEGFNTDTGYRNNTNIASGEPLPDTSIQVFNSGNSDTKDSTSLSIRAKFNHILHLPSYVCILMTMVMCISAILMYTVFIIDMFVDKGFSDSEGAV